MILSSCLRSMGQEFGSGSAKWLLFSQLESLDSIWLAAGLVWRIQKGFIHVEHFGDGDLKAGLSWSTLLLQISSLVFHTVSLVCSICSFTWQLRIQECSLEREMEAADARFLQERKCGTQMPSHDGGYHQRMSGSLKPVTLNNKLFRVFFCLLL